MTFNGIGLNLSALDKQKKIPNYSKNGDVQQIKFNSHKLQQPPVDCFENSSHKIKNLAPDTKNNGLTFLGNLFRKSDKHSDTNNNQTDFGKKKIGNPTLAVPVPRKENFDFCKQGISKATVDAVEALQNDVPRIIISPPGHAMALTNVNFYYYTELLISLIELPGNISMAILKKKVGEFYQKMLRDENQYLKKEHLEAMAQIPEEQRYIIEKTNKKTGEKFLSLDLENPEKIEERSYFIQGILKDYNKLPKQTIAALQEEQKYLDALRLKILVSECAQKSFVRRSITSGINALHILSHFLVLLNPSALHGILFSDNEKTSSAQIKIAHPLKGLTSLFTGLRNFRQRLKNNNKRAQDKEAHSVLNKLDDKEKFYSLLDKISELKESDFKDLNKINELFGEGIGMEKIRQVIAEEIEDPEVTQVVNEAFEQACRNYNFNNTLGKSFFHDEFLKQLQYCAMNLGNEKLQKTRKPKRNHGKKDKSYENKKRKYDWAAETMLNMVNSFVTLEPKRTALLATITQNGYMEEVRKLDNDLKYPIKGNLYSKQELEEHYKLYQFLENLFISMGVFDAQKVLRGYIRNVDRMVITTKFANVLSKDENENKNKKYIQNSIVFNNPRSYFLKKELEHLKKAIQDALRYR